MGSATLTRETRIEIEGRRYRLVRKSRSGDWLLEDLEDRNIIFRHETALQRLHYEAKLTFVVGEHYETWLEVQKLELTPDENAIIELRLAFVEAVEGLPKTGEIWTRAINDVWEETKKKKAAVYDGLTDPTMKRAFKKMWHKLLKSKRPFGWITVWRWQSRYNAFGRDKAALLDKNGGKRNRHDRYGSIVLDACEQAIDDIYMKAEPGTQEETFETATRFVEDEQARLDSELETIVHDHPDADPPKRLVLVAPSKRLIRRLINERPAFDVYAARHSIVAAMAKFRFVAGKDLPNEPLEEVQLDHTVLDLFVVDDTFWLPLGRPYITVCLDVFTRCILGIYIGFIPPSSVSVALCLKDAFRPKLYYADDYPSILNPMPFGVPRRIKWDNGLEEHSDQAKQACGRVGVNRIVYTGRKKPWCKAPVERWFRTLNDAIAHYTPGTTFRNIIEKGDYNPGKMAVIRLSTLKTGIRKWIADVYHQKPHRGLGGVKPMDLWTSTIKSEILRYPHDTRFLDAVMGRPEKRMLTHDGIGIHNLQYASDALKELRIQKGADLLVDIRVDEENLGRIYVLWENSQILTADAVDYQYANSLTLWQHKTFQKYQRKHNLSADGKGWLQAKEAVRQLFLADFAEKGLFKGVARIFNDGKEALTISPPSAPILPIPGHTDITSFPPKKQPVPADPVKFESFLLDELA